MNQGEGYITSEISQKEGGGLLGSERSWEFTSSDGESFSPERQSRLILCSQLLFDHRPFPNKPSPHWSPTSRPILYKFIVMGSLGLDPILHQSQSENLDPTVTLIIFLLHQFISFLVIKFAIASTFFIHKFFWDNTKATTNFNTIGLQIDVPINVIDGTSTT